jgi:hypothetical protein
MEKEIDEGRKRTLGVISAIFAFSKLSALDSLFSIPGPRRA